MDASNQMLQVPQLSARRQSRGSDEGSGILQEIPVSGRPPMHPSSARLEFRNIVVTLVLTHTCHMHTYTYICTQIHTLDFSCGSGQCLLVTGFLSV